MLLVWPSRFYTENIFRNHTDLFDWLWRQMPTAVLLDLCKTQLRQNATVMWFLCFHFHVKPVFPISITVLSSADRALKASQMFCHHWVFNFPVPPVLSLWKIMFTLSLFDSKSMLLLQKCYLLLQPFFGGISPDLGDVHTAQHLPLLYVVFLGHYQRQDQGVVLQVITVSSLWTQARKASPKPRLRSSQVLQVKSGVIGVEIQVQWQVYFTFVESCHQIVT